MYIKIMTSPQKRVSITYIVGLVMKRFQSQLLEKEIPDVLPPYHEKIVQRVMKYITSKYNVLDLWIHMEIKRIEHLLEFYNFEDLQILYPFLVTQDTYETDIEKAYKNSIEALAVPDLDLFSWVKDIVEQF